VYNNDWCRYPSGQVHEIGHNLGLNHAGEGSEEYGDQTGFMGYSYASFTTKMCYNNAKSWQLGWYGLKRETLDFSQRGGFNGTFVGVNDYLSTTGNYVVVKIVGGTSGDFFVGFNRQTGINADTQEATNQVTIQRQVGTGKSSLLAKLSAGGEFTVTNFQGTKSLIVKVTTINLSQSPSFANIMIYVDGCPPGQCGTQCNVPCPTPPPTMPPTTAPPTPPPTNPPTTPPPTNPPTTPPPTNPPTTPPPTNPPTTPPPTQPPTPPPSNMQWYQVFPVQTFDNGFGVFQVIGKTAKLNTKVVMKELGSLKSLGFTGSTSLIQTTGTYFVGNYWQLKVGFWFQSLTTATGDSFSVQISSDNGVSWQTVRQFSRDTTTGSDVWTTNGVWYNGSTEFAKPDGAQWIKLRITTAIKSKGGIYFENVSLDGR
jgi:hypothetical protein